MNAADVGSAAGRASTAYDAGAENASAAGGWSAEPPWVVIFEHTSDDTFHLSIALTHELLWSRAGRRKLWVRIAGYVLFGAGGVGLIVWERAVGVAVPARQGLALLFLLTGLGGLIQLWWRRRPAQVEKRVRRMLIKKGALARRVVGRVEVGPEGVCMSDPWVRLRRSWAQVWGVRLIGDFVKIEREMATYIPLRALGGRERAEQFVRDANAWLYASGHGDRRRIEAYVAEYGVRCPRCRKWLKTDNGGACGCGQALNRQTLPRAFRRAWKRGPSVSEETPSGRVLESVSSRWPDPRACAAASAQCAGSQNGPQGVASAAAADSMAAAGAVIPAEATTGEQASSWEFVLGAGRSPPWAVYYEMTQDEMVAAMVMLKQAQRGSKEERAKRRSFIRGYAMMGVTFALLLVLVLVVESKGRRQAPMPAALKWGLGVGVLLPALGGLELWRRSRAPFMESVVRRELAMANRRTYSIPVMLAAGPRGMSISDDASCTRLGWKPVKMLWLTHEFVLVYLENIMAIPVRAFGDLNMAGRFVHDVNTWLYASGHGDRRKIEDYLVQHDAWCPRCGYNLRELTAEMCPECGQRVHRQSVPGAFRAAAVEKNARNVE